MRLELILALNSAPENLTVDINCRFSTETRVC